MPNGGCSRLACRLFALALICAPGVAFAKPVIEAVSNRADLVSGGDVLVRVTLPAGEDHGQAVLAVNGRSVPNALQLATDGKGSLALVNGLTPGRNTVTVTSHGRSSRLEITNHARGGPLFSGPQIQPWTCREGAASAQCDRTASVSWSYMPTGGTEFRPYNPSSPPLDVARVTTSTGAALPYIVRVESFTQNRSGVSVAALYDPAKPWTPFTPQPQWNKGVFVLQGSGCGTGYAEQPAGSPMNDRALRQGFVVVTAALLHNTINCNHVVQAEAALMAKEHVAETYGLFDIVFGMGSSGGAISQLMDQNAYPGLYDGIILNHLFADSDASRRAAYDCLLVNEHWSKAGAPAWTDAQKSAVVGMLSGCASAPTRFQIYNPSVGTGCNVPDDRKYHPARNPPGVRCTLQDYQVNQVGRRASDGHANGRLDNEGVQYGLQALLAGTITPAQFVALNAEIGGHDIDFNRIATRTVADRAGLKRLYAAGVNNTLNNLSETAILETRLAVTDFHQPFHADMVQARLMRAQGHHDNYALWRTTTAREAAFDQAFDVMVAWLRAIEADTRDVPRPRKVIDNRPPLARDRCVVGGADQPLEACPRPPALTRVLAGSPDTNDVGKCRLRPLRQGDYPGVRFTGEEWASLQRTFPTGVCDWSKPLMDFQMATPWLEYLGEGRSRPLPPPPRSR